MLRIAAKVAAAPARRGGRETFRFFRAGLAHQNSLVRPEQILAGNVCASVLQGAHESGKANFAEMAAGMLQETRRDRGVFLFAVCAAQEMRQHTPGQLDIFDQSNFDQYIDTPGAVTNAMVDFFGFVARGEQERSRRIIGRGYTVEGIQRQLQVCWIGNEHFKILDQDQRWKTTFPGQAQGVYITLVCRQADSQGNMHRTSDNFQFILDKMIGWFRGRDEIELIDHGISDKLGQGYIILEWTECEVDPLFLAILRDEDTVEDYTVYIRDL